MPFGRRQFSVVNQKERGTSEKNRFCHLYIMVIQVGGMRLSGKSKGQKRIGPKR